MSERRPWYVRRKSSVEDASHLVWFYAGCATWGPKWLALVGLGIWTVRALCLRAIWRYEDAKENERA